MSIPASGSLLANAQMFELSPEHVDEGQRIGFLHEGKAAAIGRLMAVDGQRDPIKVVANPKGKDRPWRLVTGMHRLVGARIEGITVWAIEVSGKPEDLAELEASENKHRRTLNPIEDAKFVAVLTQSVQDRIARQRGGLKQQQIAVKARWARVKSGADTPEKALRDEVEDTLSDHATAYGAEGGSWEKVVGEAFGMGRDAIYRALRLHRLIAVPFPDLAEALSSHPIVGSNAKQLRDIADIKDEAARRAVIELLLDDSELSVDEAKVRLGIGLTGGASAATPVAYQKHYNAITGGWDRLGLSDKRKFLPTLATIIPPEMKRDLRDMLSKELGESGLQPAVAIRASVMPEYIVCLEDGTRHTNLTTRLVRLGMTPAEYRARWSLPLDYPMLAPNYREAREKAWRQRVRAVRLGLRRPEVADAR